MQKTAEKIMALTEQEIEELWTGHDHQPPAARVIEHQPEISMRSA